MAEGKMLEEKLFSKHLNEEMDIIIYLPPEYSPLYKYPSFYRTRRERLREFWKIA
ncbi:esterase [Listeria fleischmannii FSL S10-1203]|uniref:Esterase n=1 Tax=Listeria fleischmannii FSL S10-1203 TaxID=1265822 RepID=W7D5V6_9LIST|nr:esterase [Listeria fleischmannii FSL S10-1203]